MTSNLGKGAWNKLRFEWKKQINRSSFISRSAKQMASYLCDECVNRHTGQFFHGNETLAAGMGVDVRSIQRYLSELRRLGWLERNHVAGKRRAFQLSIPSGIDIGAKRGKGGGSEMPILSSKRDKDDAPSINQVFNNNGWNLGGPPMSSV